MSSITDAAQDPLLPGAYDPTPEQARRATRYVCGNAPRDQVLEVLQQLGLADYASQRVYRRYADGRTEKRTA